MRDTDRDRSSIGSVAVLLATAALAATLALLACRSTPSPAGEPALVEQGEEIFFDETFDGNGRTCGTCHRAEDNFGLTPGFIATLPDDDPLFVAESEPSLAETSRSRR